LNSQARLAQAALRITPPEALAAGNEQSGKMAPTTKRTKGFKNSLKGKLRL
jgi:hypothetical protein